MVLGDILRRMPIFALSIHADYRCRHSGACCTADWDVPVELPLYRTLGEALSAGRVAPVAEADDDAAPLIVEGDLPDEAAAMVASVMPIPSPPLWWGRG